MTHGPGTPVYTNFIDSGTRSQIRPVASTAARSVEPTPAEKHPRAP